MGDCKGRGEGSPWPSLIPNTRADNQCARFAESMPFRFRSPMGSKRLDNIADYRRHGFDLQVQCANCGHTKRHAAETILALCNRRGWSKQMMLLEPKFRCSQCGSRSVRCGPLERDDRTL